jgi:hypothetical protein
MRIFVLTVCGLAATFDGAQVAPPAQVPISVTISASSAELKAGSELKLAFAVTNTSDEPVLLSMTPDDFRVNVRDSEGKAVGKAKEANATSEVLHLGQWSGDATELPPHTTDRWEEIVGKNLDLSKPGKYTITFTRMYGKTPVKSNTTTITVVP